MDKLKIGITGTGSLIGQAIIKSLTNSVLNNDISIIGFDYFTNTVGSYWVNKNYILPDFIKKTVSEEQWLAEVIRIVGREGINALFIGIDFELPLFAKYKEYIESETGCRVIVSDPEVIKIADDKYLTYQFLKNNNLPHPWTQLAKELYLESVSFPCIVKPRVGSRSRDVFIIKDKQELNKKLISLKDPIVQELVGDMDSEYTCGVVYLDGNVREMMMLKRYLKDGNTETACFSKDCPKSIYDYVYNIASALKPFGSCNFQLRLDNNMCPKLFEINARHSGTTYMRALFGFNEIEYILRHIFNIKQRRIDLKYGVVKRYFGEMFIEETR